MTIAFIEGRVIVGDGQVMEAASVLVEGERILRVGSANFKTPRNCRRISLRGRTLMPGFIDAHVHLCLDGSADPISALLHDTPVTSALKASRFAAETLAAGVTTVRDMGAKDGVDLELRQAVRTGLVPGPRMLVSGRPICMTGGHGWQVGREANGADEVRKAAREQIKSGVDVIKLMATGGVMTPGVEPGSEQFTEAELRAGVEEAHKAGKKTATHAMGTKGILNALRAGIDSIEHGVYLDHEAVDLMKRQAVPFVPTLSAPFQIQTHGQSAGIPAFVLEKTLKVKVSHLESIRMARRAGVAMAMGTDAGTPLNRHGQNLGELKLLVEDGGFSPLEAIEAGTRVSARVLGLEKELGTVAEGRLADLVLVDGNPLDDIALLLQPSSIRLVVQGGKIVKDTQP